MLMKLRCTIWVAVIALVLIRSASGQGFVNLDFESATLVQPGAQYVQFAQAFPGWTVSIVAPLTTDALYDSMFLDSAGVSIIDTHAGYLAGDVIAGKYTALLQSGLGYLTNGNPGFPSDTTLSQTGLVPLGTQSLQFKAWTGFDPSGRFAVTLGGQTLSLTILGGGTNYVLYAANVSQWAGQTAQLSFTVFAEIPHRNDEELYLDDIQFSSQPVSVSPGTNLVAWISGGSIQIAWTPSGGTLESSPVLGPGATWSTVYGGQNPAVPISGSGKFFRVRP